MLTLFSSKERLPANDLVPGSAMHPGELLKDELEAREMKQIELAKALGIAKNIMSELIGGKRNITPELAVRLEDALGIKAGFWMKYQVAYEIDKIRVKNKKAMEKADIPTKTKVQMASI
ncbi:MULTISPECIES: HigA family addiction module antitoxin [unclassified Imperialibacter]|uniref:HigA family addiction module antitoxin n=1 Tax=unclassified Imperialibacter TaxID=2629706 RepID=UPI0012579204|nr:MULTISPECIES: HigA family addiction module antitoxin [unclassified Imperialibacter]CAD5258061.1 Addiction module antidote protein, HigA family [Imperialibacter sp. 75]CAD5261109.1 Addiction module antidote protein, HigA family [Imperialibacter sp. 89]VVT25059.1 Addiction module antidote protein, HigA family [Imperialibacter sp. EC-SDR9]